jgi:pyruvate,water dikinase
MDFSLLDVAARGRNAAFVAYDLPYRVHLCRVDGRIYEAIERYSVAPGNAAEMHTRAEEKLRTVMERMHEAWEDEWETDIQSHLAAMRAVDPGSAAAPNLAEAMDEALSHWQHLRDLRAGMSIPVLLSISQFEESYRELFGGAPSEGNANESHAGRTDEQSQDAIHTLEALHLVQGMPNKSIETAHELWRLSRSAAHTARVRETIAASTPDAIAKALTESGEGRAFSYLLKFYLGEYGRYSDTGLVGAPTWAEDPRTVMTALKQYVAQPERDLLEEYEEDSRGRYDLVTTLKTRLRPFPTPVVAKFDSRLQAAQTATALSEDQNFWVEYSANFELRRTLLAIGRRLAGAHVLADPADIGHLTPDEVRATLVTRQMPDRRALVASRQSELAAWATLDAPRTLGAPTPAAPPDDPMGRALAKYYGTPVEQTAGAGVLRGHAGSPGVVRGPARLISTLADAYKLQPGDIMVAPATCSAWTLLFATAAAVVTDSGGELGSTATLAREYRIPAVVGATGASERLHDGEMVEVDGALGVIDVPGE